MRECDLKLLSICVPTYNRVRYLRELLPILVEEIAPYAEETELVIVDNSSTDETAEFVATIAEGRLYVRSFRNAKNIGGCRNFWRCVEVARGKYVLLHGDDDLIVPGSIRRILAALKECPNPGLVICCPKGLPHRECRYQDYRHLIIGEWRINPKLALQHTLMTCNVFLREAFDFDLARCYLWTDYPQMFAMESLLHRPVTILPDILDIREPEAHGEFEHPIYFLKTKQGFYLAWCGWKAGCWRLLGSGLVRMLKCFKELRRMIRAKLRRSR